MLSVGLLDLFLEALKLTDNTEQVFYIAAVAILFLFLIERLIWWYNHHRDDNKNNHRCHPTPSNSQDSLLLHGHG